MPISIGKNLKIVETNDSFITDFQSNFEEAYNRFNVNPYFIRSVDANICGSPFNTNGVYSGFSPSNYIWVNNKIISTITSLEEIIKIHVNNIIPSDSTIDRQCIVAGEAYVGIVSIHITNTGTLKIYISSNGTSNNISNGTESTLTVNENTDYWIKFTWNGSIYKLSVSTNGSTYTDYITINSSEPPAFNGKLGYGTDTGAFYKCPFEGSIDFNSTSVKINGQHWWGGCTDNASLYGVLMSFASYKTLKYTGLPNGAYFQWYLPDNVYTTSSVNVITNSLVPYVITFSNSSKYINYVRANENKIIDCTDLTSNTVTLTIAPNPSTATVVLEVEGGNPFNFQQSGKSITVSPGTKVKYTVSKTDYITQSNTIIVNETQTVNVRLSATLYTYIIHPTPADAIVTLTAEGYTQLDNSISVPRGTSVNWTVSAPNYVSQSGTKIVNNNCADNISLKELIEFTITPTPSNATVTLIATGYSQVGNSIRVPYGTTVVWMVEKEGYATRSGSKMLTEDTEAQIILDEMLTFTIIPSPSDAIVNITSPGYIQHNNSITVPSGTLVNWMVSKEGMETKTGKKVVTISEDYPVVLYRYVTLTITPTPADAVVELTATGYEQEGNSITVGATTRVHWKVYRTGYLPKSGYITVNDDTSYPVSLIQSATLTINPTPADAIVTLTAEGYGQYGNKISVPLNTTVYWSVVKSGYKGQYGSENMTVDKTKNITLVQS